MPWQETRPMDQRERFIADERLASTTRSRKVRSVRPPPPRREACAKESELSTGSGAV
jgi:hypothetical protein